MHIIKNYLMLRGIYTESYYMKKRDFQEITFQVRPPLMEEAYFFPNDRVLTQRDFYDTLARIAHEYSLNETINSNSNDTDDLLNYTLVQTYISRAIESFIDIAEIHYSHLSYALDSSFMEGLYDSYRSLAGDLCESWVRNEEFLKSKQGILGYSFNDILLFFLVVQEATVDRINIKVANYEAEKHIHAGLLMAKIEWLIDSFGADLAIYSTIRNLKAKLKMKYAVDNNSTRVIDEVEKMLLPGSTFGPQHFIRKVVDAYYGRDDKEAVYYEVSKNVESNWNDFMERINEC